MRILISIVFCVQIAYSQIVPKEPIRYLALGDSYTIGESVTYENRWPTILFDSLKKSGYNFDTLHYIARTGWRTDNLINSINTVKPDSNYNLVSLLIGVNNQYQGSTFSNYEKEFPELLKTAIALASGNKENVFVVSIPDYRFTPFGNGTQNPSVISNELDKYNEYAKEICDSNNVLFFNITPISREGLNNTNLVANDGLHPSGLQYKEWVNLILSNEITSTIDLKAPVFSYYPNPTNEIMQFNKIMKWKIIDLKGNLVSEGISNTAYTAGIKNGTYTLLLDKHQPVRLIIKH